MRKISLTKRKINLNKLIDYGFKKIGDIYFFKCHLPNFPFVACYSLIGNELECHLIDDEFNEDYELVDVTNVISGYAKLVNEEYEKVTNDIILECTEQIKTQMERIIDYVTNQYNDNLEYLWNKFPNDAIIRRKDNKKWYCLFMKINAKKLGMDSEDILDVIDLRGNEDKIALIDNKVFFSGYHMNKNHWFTLILDERMNDQEIISLIYESHLLAK